MKGLVQDLCLGMSGPRHSYMFWNIYHSCALLPKYNLRKNYATYSFLPQNCRMSFAHRAGFWPKIRHFVTYSMTPIFCLGALSISKLILCQQFSEKQETKTPAVNCCLFSFQMSHQKSCSSCDLNTKQQETSVLLLNKNFILD